jgi:hypothetical protein
MKRFNLLMLMSMALGTPAFAAKFTPVLEHRYERHGISDFIFTNEYQGCANFPISVGVEKAEVVQPKPFGFRQATVKIAVGDSDSLSRCHAPGSLETLSVRFSLQSNLLREFSGLIALIPAVDYQLFINGQYMGLIRVGIVGEHEFIPKEQ